LDPEAHPLEYTSIRFSERATPGRRESILGSGIGTGISPVGGCNHAGADRTGSSGASGSSKAEKNCMALIQPLTHKTVN